jgi:hypothetical protein
MFSIFTIPSINAGAFNGVKKDRERKLDLFESVSAFVLKLIDRDRASPLPVPRLRRAGSND